MTPAPAPSSGAVRVYERYEGQGTAFGGERELAAVEYAIKDVDEVYHAALEPGAPPAQVVGPRTPYGVLRTAQAAALAAYVGERLVLHLGDGRRLDFTITKVLGAEAVLIRGLGRVR